MEFGLLSHHYAKEVFFFFFLFFFFEMKTKLMFVKVNVEKVILHENTHNHGGYKKTTFEYCPAGFRLK